MAKIIKIGHGGAREGAGRKAVEFPLVSKSFRVDEYAYNQAKEKHGRTLNQKINDLIKKLAVK